MRKTNWNAPLMKTGTRRALNQARNYKQKPIQNIKTT